MKYILILILMPIMATAQVDTMYTKYGKVSKKLVEITKVTEKDGIRSEVSEMYNLARLEREIERTQQDTSMYEQEQYNIELMIENSRKDYKVLQQKKREAIRRLKELEKLKAKL